MKKIIIVLVFFGCSNIDQHDPVYDVHPELEYFLNEFMYLADSMGVEIDIPDAFEMSFNHYIDGAGVTRIHPNGLNQIIISSSFFTWGHKTKRYVMFHELGHALLSRSHNNDEFSIMYSNSNDPWKALNNFFGMEEEMINELFYPN